MGRSLISSLESGAPPAAFEDAFMLFANTERCENTVKDFFRGVQPGDLRQRRSRALQTDGAQIIGNPCENVLFQRLKFPAYLRQAPGLPQVGYRFARFRLLTLAAGQRKLPDGFGQRFQAFSLAGRNNGMCRPVSRKGSSPFHTSAGEGWQDRFCSRQGWCVPGRAPRAMPMCPASFPPCRRP